MVTKKHQLINRIENNYMDFKISLRGVSREKLFNMACRIAAVTEAHDYLTDEYEWDEESEVDFYLLFLNPLEIIADAWENRRNEMTEDFDDALFDVGYSDTVMSEYPLIKGVETNLYDKIMSFPN